MLTVHCSSFLAEELWADDEGNCFRSIYSPKEAINYTYNCITGNPGLDLTQSIFYNLLQVVLSHKLFFLCLTEFHHGYIHMKTSESNLGFTIFPEDT